MPRKNNSEIVNQMFFGERATRQPDEFIIPAHLDDEDELLIEHLCHVSSRERFEEVYPPQLWADEDQLIELPF